jgi:hypothetical protein
MTFVRQLPVQSVATRSGLIDKRHMGRLRLHPLAKPVNVACPGADLAKAFYVSKAYRVRHHDRVFMNVQTHKYDAVVAHVDLHVGNTLLKVA